MNFLNDNYLYSQEACVKWEKGIREVSTLLKLDTDVEALFTEDEFNRIFYINKLFAYYEIVNTFLSHNDTISNIEEFNTTQMIDIDYLKKLIKCFEENLPEHVINFWKFNEKRQQKLRRKREFDLI